MSSISSLEDFEIDILRNHLLSDFRAFSHFSFKVMKGVQMKEVDYYDVLFEVIQMLIDQESNRMIINIPPRAGKTLIISIFLPLYAWAKCPFAQTILTGFNSDVIQECTGFIRTIMSDPDFMRVFPDVIIDNSKKSVEKLGTMSAGVIHAIPTTGKMTGKGCGDLTDEFAGLMSIDDVIKPDDANSPTERDKINARFSNTLLSRLATETTPLVVMMQRLHIEDLCGFLMRGGTHDKYHWLNIPGIVTRESGSAEWYQDQIDRNGYSHVIPVLYDLKRSDDKFDANGESSFWPIRKDITTLQGLRDKDPYTFSSQYMGEPVGRGSQALKPEDIHYYYEEDSKNIKYSFITADTAATVETYSDYTVAIHWGVTKDKPNKLMILDARIGKWEVPELIIAMREFWEEKNVFHYNTPTLKPTYFYMEDKSSGLHLNQQFLRDRTVRVKPVPRDGTKDSKKFSRFMNTIPYFQQGRILIPKSHEHTQHMVRELLGQSEYGSNTGNDDVADNVADAVDIAFAQQKMSYESWA